MKSIKYIILFVGILNVTSLTSQQINFADLQSDISFLIQKLEEVHPNPYFNIAKKDFIISIDSLVKNESLEEDITSLQFWKTFAPVISSLKDGHTELALPNHAVKDYYGDKNIVFPFEIDISGSKLFVVKNYSTNKTLRTPVEVTKINSIPAKVIIATMKKYTSAELESFQNKIIKTRFQRYYTALFDYSESYTLE